MGDGGTELVSGAADTSVAVPMVLVAHPLHAAVSKAVRDRALVLAGHAAVETYSVLTRLPPATRISPEDALTLVESQFAGTVGLRPDDQQEVLRNAAAAGIAGGRIYDALVGSAAAAAGLLLITRDRRAMATYAVLGVGYEVLG